MVLNLWGGFKDKDMGYDATAQTIIGVKINEKHLYENKPVRCCQHPEKDSKFCSECGKPMWKDCQVRKDFYDDDNVVSEVFNLVELQHADWCFIGLVAESGSQGAPVKQTITDIEFVKQELKEVLEPLGLWEEESFGIWTNLLESC